LSLAAGIEDDDGDHADNSTPVAASASKPQHKTVAKKASASAPPSAALTVVGSSAWQVVKSQIHALPETARTALLDAFKKQFDISAQTQITADYINTQERLDFLAAQLHELKAAATA
jgi:hypothetical protein